MNGTNDCWSPHIHQIIAKYASSQLWRHIRNNAKESEAEESFLNLTKLSGKDLQLIADIRWLLSDNVQRLLREIAPKIINRLSKASVNETVIDRNKIKGRVNWQKTTEIRTAEGNDKSLFVCTQRSQIFDLPENRLFLHLLQKANETAKSFVSDEYMSLTWYAESDLGGKWLNKISVIASRTDRMLKFPAVSKIGSTKEISPKFISVAEKCRQAEYRELALIADDYQKKHLSPLSYLNRELKGNILEPLNKDTLYEIAVLFRTMETAEKCGWTEIKAGLIGGTSKTVSIFRKDNTLLRIYTQHIPTEFRDCSAYGPIMNSYGLSEKMRRPDIILEFDSGSQKQFLIVEVKRSQSRSYLADGTYKLLGYLKDFEKVREDFALSGFLVGWSGIANMKYKQGSEVGLFSWENYSAGIEVFLNSIK